MEVAQFQKPALLQMQQRVTDGRKINQYAGHVPKPGYHHSGYNECGAKEYLSGKPIVKKAFRVFLCFAGFLGAGDELHNRR